MPYSRRGKQQSDASRTEEHSVDRKEKRDRQTYSDKGYHTSRRRHTAYRNSSRQSESSDHSSESPISSRLRSQNMHKSRKRYNRRKESRQFRSASLSNSWSRGRSRSYSHGSRRTRRDMKKSERPSSILKKRGRKRIVSKSRSPLSRSWSPKHARSKACSSPPGRSWKKDRRSRPNRTHRRSRSRRRNKRIKEESARDQDSRDDSDDSGTHDDTIGTYDGRAGDYIASRYKIIREAGIGTFGRVLECTDKQRRRTVAIKVVRKVEKYCESAKIEARILQDVNEGDNGNESLCVRMFKWFEYQGHVCLVFERLGCSLYEYLKSHDYKPFPIDYIRAVAWQLLAALDYIHSIKLIHTDLKPENILLVDDREKRSSHSSSSASSSIGNEGDSNRRKYRKQEQDASHCAQWRRHHSKGNDRGDRKTLPTPAFNAVKLIDFGGATYDDESKSSIINTRQYRSPEVILGVGWSYPSDIWSAGCIVAELYLGDLLFATHDNMEHLALIETCIGRLPSKMVSEACRKSASSFFHRSRLAWPQKAASTENINHVRRMRTLGQIVSPEHAKLGFLDLLQQMLVLDPKERISAKEAMRHPFFESFSQRDITRPGSRHENEHHANHRSRRKRDGSFR